jgi:hypothetical protein
LKKNPSIYKPESPNPCSISIQTSEEITKKEVLKAVKENPYIYRSEIRNPNSTAITQSKGNTKKEALFEPIISPHHSN